MAETRPRQIRIPNERWERFDELAEPTRAKVVNDFIAWFNREPGAKLPRRPRPDVP
jgi:hypothetical protein